MNPFNQPQTEAPNPIEQRREVRQNQRKIKKENRNKKIARIKANKKEVNKVFDNSKARPNNKGSARKVINQAQKSNH